MNQEATQNQPATSSGNKGNINFNRQTGRKPSTTGLVVTVEGVPRRPSTVSSTSSAKMKIARRLSLAAAGLPNQPQQQNQPASSTVSTLYIVQVYYTLSLI